MAGEGRARGGAGRARGSGRGSWAGARGGSGPLTRPVCPQEPEAAAAPRAAMTCSGASRRSRGPSTRTWRKVRPRTWRGGGRGSLGAAASAAPGTPFWRPRRAGGAEGTARSAEVRPPDREAAPRGYVRKPRSQSLARTRVSGVACGCLPAPGAAEVPAGAGHAGRGVGGPRGRGSGWDAALGGSGGRRSGATCPGTTRASRFLRLENRSAGLTDPYGHSVRF